MSKLYLSLLSGDEFARSGDAACQDLAKPMIQEDLKRKTKNKTKKTRRCALKSLHAEAYLVVVTVHTGFANLSFLSFCVQLCSYNSPEL
jgi:hypothetical protein